MDADQKRKEYKFVLPAGVGDSMRAEVSKHLAVDRDFEEGYPVMSEYFDSDERDNYWQKQFGLSNRRKVRTRLYGDGSGALPPSAFVEVKHKSSGGTVKRRVMVGQDEMEEFSTGASSLGDDFDEEGERLVAQEIEGLIREGSCRRVVQIRYHRYAFDSGPEGRIRITFDVDPRCRFDLVPMTPGDLDFEFPLLGEGMSIMEVKTIGAVPYWFRELLGEYQLVPRGFSKYATALELYEFQFQGKHAKEVV